ncbi:MAG: hypothetical protein AABZ47_11510 [Planctomycetota bacterium]
MLTSDELERLTDATWGDNSISMSLHCGCCGYNLRTLPYVYQCPECGREYSARPDRMHGIFFPDQAKFPFLDPFASLVSTGSALILFGFGSAWGLMSPAPVVPIGAPPTATPPPPQPSAILMTMGAVFVMLAIIYAVRAWRRLFLFYRGRKIISRMHADAA